MAMFALPLRLVLALGCVVCASSASVTERTANYDVSAVLQEMPPIPHRIAAMTRSIKSFRQATKRVVNSRGSCRWDTAKDACVVGYSAAADVFGKSGNAQAQFVANYERCLAAVDAEECAAISNCAWDTDSLTCHFLDFYTGHEKSPCVVGAEGFVRQQIAKETCRLHKSQLPCITDRSCEWNQEELSCEASLFTFFIGVPISKVVDAAHAVIGHKSTELLFRFYTSFDLFGESFEPADILDWEIPETSCPDWSDQLVCDYADGVLSTMAQSYYCGAKHQGFQGLLECATDPLCELDPSSFTCRQTDDSFRSGVFKGIKTVVSKYVQLPVDKKLLLRSFECVEIEEKEKCTSPCVWVADKTAPNETGICGIPNTWSYNVVAEAGDDSDPICRMASALAKTNCVDITDPEACDAEPDCTSLLPGNCWVSVDYQAKDVAETDSDLKAAYDELEAVCSSCETEEACHGKM